MRKALAENFGKFINKRAEELSRKYLITLSKYSAPENSAQDSLQAAIKALQNNDSIACSLPQLAQFCAATWYYYSQNASIDHALGMALSVLNRPRYASLFEVVKKKALFNSYKENVKKYEKEISPYINGRANDKEPLDKALLVKNYKNYFLADNTSDAKSEQQPEFEPIILNPWEHALIKNYLQAVGKSSELYDSAYNQLCQIDWDKLHLLFSDTKLTTKKKESLFVRTRQLFEDNQGENEGHEFPEEEQNRIESLLKGSASALDQEQKNELYKFLRKHIVIFNQAPKLKNEWEKRIVSGQKYNDNDFILALTKAIINIMPTQGDADSKIESVTLKLQGSLNNLKSINYHVGCYFSVRFGGFLRQLMERLNADGKNHFIVSCPSSVEDLDAHPLFNFAGFFAAHKAKTPELAKSNKTGKDNTSYKFYLQAKYKNGSEGERYLLEWRFDDSKAKAIGYYLYDDLLTVNNSKTLQSGVFALNAISANGHIQTINLKDKSTFLKVYKLNIGAFFRKDPVFFHDIKLCFNDIYGHLAAFFEQYEDHELEEQFARQSLQELAQVKEAFEAFEKDYFEVISNYCQCKLNYHQVRLMRDRLSLITYQLLNSSFVSKSQNYKQVRDGVISLIECLGSVGMAYLDQHMPYYVQQLQDESLKAQVPKSAGHNFVKNTFAIATPLAPQSLHNFALRNERMLCFIEGVFNNTLLVQDRKMIQETFDAEAKLCEGSEITFNFINNLNNEINTKSILINSQACNGYTLYDSPESLKQSVAISGSTISSKAVKKSENTRFDSKPYEDAAVEFVEKYIKSRPYLKEQCTIMIYYCGIAQLPLAIYKQLLESDSLSSIQFHLVVVNCSVKESQQIYKSFEDARYLNGLNAYQSEGNYTQRVKVSVLADYASQEMQEEQRDNQYFDANISESDGVFGHFLDLHSFKSESQSQRDKAAWHRIADICLMFHVFDSQASYDFSTNSHISLLDDELKLCRSMVSYTDLECSSSGYIGKYVVSPELNVNDIIEQHALYFLVKQEIKAFSDTQAELSFIEDKAKLTDSDYALSLDKQLNISKRIRVPLFEFKTNTGSRLGFELINKVQKHSDVVVYIDELMCRSLLENNELKIIYHQKVNSSALNLLIASKEASAQSGHFIFTLLNELDILDKDEQEQVYSRILDDAIAISGNIIMQAQIRKNNAREMMGLVLCKHIVTQAFAHMAKRHQLAAMLHEPCLIPLDDYAASLGYKSGLLSDILAIQVFKRNKEGNSLEQISPKNGSWFNDIESLSSPIDKDHLMVLYVIESKFFSTKDDNARKKSLEQTMSSVDNLQSSLKSTPGQKILDKSIVLASLANLMQFTSWKIASKPKYISALRQVQHLITNEQVDIVIKGSSMFFAVEASQVSARLNDGITVTMSPSLEQQKRSKRVPVTQITMTNDVLKQVVHDIYVNSSDSNESKVLEYLIDADKDNLLSRYLTLNSQEIIHLNVPQSEELSSTDESYPSNRLDANESAQEPSAALNNSQGPALEIAPQQSASSSKELELPATMAQVALTATKPLAQTETQAPARASKCQELQQRETAPAPTCACAKLSGQEQLPTMELKSGSLEELFWQQHPHVKQLLEESSESIDFNDARMRQKLEDTAQALVQGLQELGFSPNLKSKKLTCNGALYTFEGNRNFQVEKISAQSKNLMTSYCITIMDIRPKPGEIDLYVNLNDHFKIGYLPLLKLHKFNFDLYEKEGKQHLGYNSQFVLGLGDESGEPVYIDCRKDSPHTLIGGSTGSGKSVCLKTLLLDMAITNSPEELQLILVDPKGGVDFHLFRNLPHLKEHDIITNQHQAIELMQSLVDIMDKRYEQFDALNKYVDKQDQFSPDVADNIDTYNRLCNKYHLERMPRLYFVMDEFLDWFIDPDFREQANICVNRLSCKSRAAGIHLILSTQRPDAKIMDSSIKAQLNNRICLKTTDSTNSKIILGSSGEADASKLAGKGHMICKLDSYPHAQLAQGGFLDNKIMAQLIYAITLDYQKRA